MWPEIFQYDFMIRALLAGVAVGLVSPAIGMFLVVRRLSLLGEGLGHAAFAGVALGWIFGAYPPVTALGFAALAAVGIEKLRGWQKLHGDVALAIFLYTSLALGVVLVGMGKGFGGEAVAYLFGSIVTTSPQDLPVMLALGVVALAILLAFYKEFFATALDEEAARVAGLPVTALNMALMVLTAVTVTAAMRVAGTLLVAALMVIPVVAALQLNQGFGLTLAISMGYGAGSVLLGLLASFYLDLPSGGAVVLASVGLLVLVIVAKQILALLPGGPRQAKVPPPAGSQGGGRRNGDRELLEDLSDGPSQLYYHAGGCPAFIHNRLG